jgi:hypothetical protein
MRTLEGIIILAGVSILAVVSLFGCATSQVNLVKENTARVEIVSSKDTRASISNADLNQNGNELVVMGTVNNQEPLFTTYDGHIDVVVIAPNGGAVRIGTARYHHFPSRRRSSSFTLRFPMIAEKGTLVRLAFHRVDGADSEKLHTLTLDMLHGKAKAALP